MRDCELLPERHAAAGSLRGSWTLHRIDAAGNVLPPINMSVNFKRVRRWDGGMFREAGKSESAASFLAPGILAAPAPRVGAAIACAGSGKDQAK